MIRQLFPLNKVSDLIFVDGEEKKKNLVMGGMYLHNGLTQLKSD